MDTEGLDLSRRVALLERRVKVLEKRLGIENTEENSRPSYRMPMEPIVGADGSVKRVTNNSNIQNKKPIQPVTEAKSNINSDGLADWVKSQEVQAAKRAQAKKNEDVESFIGKNVLVVVASVLIFIGVVVFASLLLPHLTTEMKFALMLVASIGLTGFGYFITNRKQNILSISVLACGLGTVYITLFTGNLYFKIVDNIVLYIGLLMWTLTVYFCSKYKEFVFNLIGQIGIVMSLILCVGSAMIKKDPSYVLYATIYIAVAEILYDILFKEDGYIINALSVMASVLILGVPVISEFNKNNGSGSIVIPMVVLSCLFVYGVVKNIIMARKEDISQNIYAIINYAALFVFGVSMFEISDCEPVTNIMMIIFALMIFAITEFIYFEDEREATLQILSGVTVCSVMFEYCRSVSDMKPFISVLVLLIPLVYYICKTNTTCSKIVLAVGVGFATLCNLFYAFDSDYRFITAYGEINSSISGYDMEESLWRTPVLQYQSILFYLSGVVVAAIGYFMFYHGKKIRKKVESIFVYLFIIANVLIPFMTLSYYNSYYEPKPFEHIMEVRCLLIMTLMFVIQLLFKSSRFFRKVENLFSQSTFVVYFVVNALMMLISISYLYGDLEYVGADLPYNNSIIIYLMGCILLVALATLNSSELLSKKNSAVSVYVGIKATILIFIVMHVFDVQPLVSIMLFIWAIACIMIGLKLSQKHLRIYALVLAIICAVKLTMIDISYRSTLARAFSFIVCGGLCFVISYIYHRIDKMSKENEIEY